MSRERRLAPSPPVGEVHRACGATIPNPPSLRGAKQTKQSMTTVSEPWIAMTASSRTHAFPQPLDRGLDAALAVRDIERVEADFDDAERAQDHRGVDVAHMGDPERLAVQFADPDAEHHAAFFLAEIMQRGRIVAASHHHRGDGVGSLAGFRDVETEHLAFPPNPD